MASKQSKPSFRQTTTAPTAIPSKLGEHHNTSLHGISAQQALNLIHKKHQKLLLKGGQQLLSSHFGPGSNNLSILSSTRKQLDEDEDDGDMEEEEGLDEREPEKAIFSERYYKVSNKELIEEFKNQVIQLKQEEMTASQQANEGENDKGGDSGNKKNKRKKKKRQKAKQMRQE